jgi:hypothetical protein
LRLDPEPGNAASLFGWTRNTSSVRCCASCVFVVSCWFKVSVAGASSGTLLQQLSRNQRHCFQQRVRPLAGDERSGCSRFFQAESVKWSAGSCEVRRRVASYAVGTRLDDASLVAKHRRRRSTRHICAPHSRICMCRGHQVYSPETYGLACRLSHAPQFSQLHN